MFLRRFEEASAASPSRPKKRKGPEQQAASGRGRPRVLFSQRRDCGYLIVVVISSVRVRAFARDRTTYRRVYLFALSLPLRARALDAELRSDDDEC